MIGDKLVIEPFHTERASDICNMLASRIQGRFTLSVAGESGAGKSELAAEIARLLNEGGTGAGVLAAEGTYTSLLNFVDFRIFIDRDYKQTLEARVQRARDKFDAFMVDVLEREHQIISQHKELADVVVTRKFDRLVFNS